MLAPVVRADPEAEAVLSLGPRRRPGRYLVALAPVRDLLLCAKHLFVARDICEPLACFRIARHHAIERWI